MAVNHDYFTTRDAAQRLDLIHHLIENSEIVPLVRGPTGIGKTVLALRLKQMAPPNWSICYFEADNTMSPDHLLASIARCLGWSKLNGDLLEGLVERFAMLRDRGKIPVFLVDNAHLLPPTSLITLLRLYERQQAGEPLISLVLFANEQIDMLLATPQLQIMSPQSIQAIDLLPFNREDTTTYMHYLLQVEGLPADLELDDARLTKLFRETKGNPGMLQQAILQVIVAEDKRPISWVTGHSLSIIIGTILLLISGLLLFQDEINRLFQHPEPTSTVELGESMQLQQNELNIDPVQTDAIESLKQTEEIFPDDNLATILAPFDWIGDVEYQFNESLTQEKTYTAVNKVAEEQEIKLLGEEAIESEIAQAPLEEAPNAQDEKTPEAIDIVQDVVVSDFSLPENPVAVAIEIEPKFQSQTDSLLRESWVLTRPAMHYTLQLLGVENLQSLKAFIERHNLRDEAFYIETKRNGKSWYPLLWGEYPDKISAIDGSHKLPLEVQSKGVWVRRFGALHDLLER